MPLYNLAPRCEYRTQIAVSMLFSLMRYWHRRAVQTAAIINRDWQLRPRLKSSLTPDTPQSELEAMLATFRGERLLLVSHNPLLSNAIAHWHDGDNKSYWGMQPASMALISADVFAQGCGNLEWLRHYPNYDHNGR